MDDNLIRSRKTVGQIVDFNGMRFGSISPTDIDGFLDFGNKLFVLFEVKRRGAEVPFGQRLALERSATAMDKGGIITVVLIVVHDTSGDIDLARCMVTERYYKGKWITPTKEVTAKEAVKTMLDWIGWKV